MKKTGQLTQTEVERKVDQAWQAMLKNNGLFHWNPGNVTKTLKQTNVPPETRVAQGLTGAAPRRGREAQAVEPRTGGHPCSCARSSGTRSPSQFR